MQQKAVYVDSAAALGTRVRDLRRASRLTLRELAFPGCSAAYLSRIERGDRVPSLGVLVELGRRLGVSTRFLASGHQSGASPLDELDAANGNVSECRLDVLNRALDVAETNEERAWVLAELGQAALVRADSTLAIAAFKQALSLLAA